MEQAETGKTLDTLFERLAQSSFRRRIKLWPKEKAYLKQKGLPVIRRHARAFISERVAPAFPKNDGKQTPMHNHPVFVAQHATGTCCRDCLRKWHRIPKGTKLTDEQIEYIVTVLIAWLQQQPPADPPPQSNQMLLL